MGCDIHWCIERRGKDGVWRAVNSKGCFYNELFSMRQDRETFHEKLMRDPRSLLGNRSYILFGMLSSVRFDWPGETIMTPDLPEDSSGYASVFLDDSCDLHSQGYCSLGRLRSVADNPALLLPELGDPDANPDIHDGDPRGGKVAAEEFIDALVNFRRIFEDVLEGQAAPIRPLIPEDLEETEDMSRHEYLEHTARLQNLRESDDISSLLEPIGDETVRLLISYDN